MSPKVSPFCTHLLKEFLVAFLTGFYGSGVPVVFCGIQLSFQFLVPFVESFQHFHLCHFVFLLVIVCFALWHVY